ncbi:MAG: xanthine dehydrogenase family protein subunit M [Rhodobacteraceae bacterium]|nr:xanthine dehydrogenase family protein subunit M [Paracoccaceae bacterium]
MYNFEFEKPKTITDAVTALAVEEAQALGGGQTLIPTLKQRLAKPSTLVSLTGIAEMQGVYMADDGVLCIGGATTHATVAADVTATYPALADMANHIGDPAVRNRGTIGGSLANNDPAACYPAAVLGSDAQIITTARTLSAAAFFQGLFTTALEEGELITQVRFPIPERAAYAKFAQPASRFAMVGVFVARFATGVRVAITGASETGVFRWEQAETALTEAFSPAAIEPLSIAADNMLSDMHSSAAYRAHLVKVMTARAVEAAC